MPISLTELTPKKIRFITLLHPAAWQERIVLSFTLAVTTAVTSTTGMSVAHKTLQTVATRGWHCQLLYVLLENQSKSIDQQSTSAQPR